MPSPVLQGSITNLSVKRRLVFFRSEVVIDGHSHIAPLLAPFPLMVVHRECYPSDSRTAFRALARRDITVPIGSTIFPQFPGRTFPPLHKVGGSRGNAPADRRWRAALVGN